MDDVELRLLTNIEHAYQLNKLDILMMFVRFIEFSIDIDLLRGCVLSTYRR
jgi:hypothetical protein